MRSIEEVVGILAAFEDVFGPDVPAALAGDRFLLGAARRAAAAPRGRAGRASGSRDTHGCC